MPDSSQAVSKRRWRSLFYLLAGAGIVSILLYGILRRRRKGKPLGEAEEARQDPAPLAIQGLSEEEVEKRRVKGQDNIIVFKPPRSRRTVIRESSLTVFNLSLIALVLVQLVFGRMLDALITFGLLIFAVAANLFQEEFVRLRLRKLQESARPKATAIRDGKATAIDPREIVTGDILAVGPGDLILADGTLVGEGEILVDETMLADDGAAAVKGSGDPVNAGAFCLRGRGVYRAERIGEERLIITRLHEAESASLILTPIERILKRILTLVLILVMFIVAVAVIRYFRIGTYLPTDEFIDAVTVVLNLAPASLFFMVVLTYTSSTADLSRVGALVPRSRSVETLSQVDIVCFSKEGLLTGSSVDIKSIEGADGTPPLPDHRLRQILGDFARSTSVSDVITRTLAANFEGDRRPIVEQIPFPALYGWSAVVFDDEDLRGVYVLGDPLLLHPYLVSSAPHQVTEDDDGDPSPPGLLRRRVSSVGGALSGLFRRSGGQPAGEPEEQVGVRSPEVANDNQSQDGSENPPEGNKEPARGLFSRIRGGFSGVLRRAGQAEKETPRDEGSEEPDIQSLLAYQPEVTALYSPAGEPVLPGGLIPLCSIEFRSQVRPEAVEAAGAFARQGIRIKIFSLDPPDEVVKLINRAGEGQALPQMTRALEGEALENMTPADLLQAAQDHDIFGNLTQYQGAQIVHSLRDAGHTVAVIGNTVSDIPTMLQGNLALVHQTSDPATLSLADIILLEDSPALITKLLDRGQRIVNGLLDVLKLYLSQIFYVLGLIIMIRFLSNGFPYTSAEGGMIGIFALALPAVGFSIWALSGRPPTRNLARLLTVFVMAASVTTAIAGFAVFQFILNRTASMDYSQTALTHALIAIGLLLAIVIRPPLRFERLARPVVLDVRPTLLALVSAIAYLVLTHIPLAQKLLKVNPLTHLTDYLLVGIAGLLWILLFFIVYRIIQWIAGLFPSAPDILSPVKDPTRPKGLE